MGIKEAEVGNFVEARKDAAAALALARTRDVEIIAALVLARSGDRQRAEELADELRKGHPLDTIMNRYWLPAIRAAIEVSGGRASQAIQLLQSASPYDLASPYPLGATGYPPFLRGQAYLEVGEGREAADEFQKLLSHRGLFSNFPLVALAQLGFARAQALSGDTAGARQAYEVFLLLWKDADPDVPILRNVKSEYAKLQQPSH
jgi:predicted Zn-dependent protease